MYKSTFRTYTVQVFSKKISAFIKNNQKNSKLIQRNIGIIQEAHQIEYVKLKI
jgi:CDP-glycerol glycerophosphotransferase (TagB/SpsB family)